MFIPTSLGYSHVGTVRSKYKSKEGGRLELYNYWSVHLNLSSILKLIRSIKFSININFITNISVVAVLFKMMKTWTNLIFWQCQMLSFTHDTLFYSFLSAFSPVFSIPPICEIGVVYHLGQQSGRTFPCPSIVSWCSSWALISISYFIFLAVYLMNNSPSTNSHLCVLLYQPLFGIQMRSYYSRLTRSSC